MAKPTCSIEGCGAPVLARGWCNAHYKQQRRRAGAFSRPTDEERFLSQVDTNGPVAANDASLGQCWLWLGTMADGYGRFGADKRKYPAHRWAYEHWIGQVPSGLVLDHFACDNPPCVNPTHVTPVTHQQNTLRSSIAVTAINARKTHCVRGHEFTEANTHLIPSGRSCRECERIRGSRSERAKRKLAKAAGASP